MRAVEAALVWRRAELIVGPIGKYNTSERRSFGLEQTGERKTTIKWTTNERVLQLELIANYGSHKSDSMHRSLQLSRAEQSRET